MLSRRYGNVVVLPDKYEYLLLREGEKARKKEDEVSNQTGVVGAIKPISRIRSEAN